MKVIVNQTISTEVLSSLHLFIICTLLSLAIRISKLEALCTVMVYESIYKPRSSFAFPVKCTICTTSDFVLNTAVGLKLALLHAIISYY